MKKNEISTWKIIKSILTDKKEYFIKLYGYSLVYDKCNSLESTLDDFVYLIDPDKEWGSSRIVRPLVKLCIKYFRLKGETFPDTSKNGTLKLF